MKKLLIAIILLMPFNVFAYSDFIMPGGETIGISVNNDGVASVVILTHVACEKEMKAALAEIEALTINQAPVKLLRIEDI